MIDPLMEIKLTEYSTTKTYCGCPDYQYRQARIQGQCKHMKYLIQKTKDILEQRTLEAKFDSEDFRGKGMSLHEAGEKYGDDMIAEWSRVGKITKVRTKWRLLE